MKTRLKHKFVDYIPDEIKSDTIYISLQYSTAVHKCVCGCGCEVVTPLSPTDWSVKFNGETVTLDPSIGNWNFKCQSHYWIEDSKVIRCRKWNNYEIEGGRKNDNELKNKFFNKKKKSHWLKYFVSKFIHKISSIYNSSSLE